MGLHQARALDPDAVGVLEVLLVVGGRAAPERGPQTGDRGRVSYAGLVLDLDRTHRGPELLDQVVLLVVERGAAEVRERQRVGVLLVPVALAGGDHPVGDHLHRRLNIEVLPVRTARSPVAHVREPAGLLDQLPRRRAARAQRPLADRRARVALDVDQLAVARVHELAAPEGAVGADRLGDLQPGDPRARLARALRGRGRAEPPVRGASDDGQLTKPLEHPGPVAHSSGLPRSSGFAMAKTPATTNANRRMTPIQITSRTTINTTPSTKQPSANA